jgi:hypothetical protein
MKIGRNDPCHCGSGKKYKKCCSAKDDAARSAELAAEAAARSAINAGDASAAKPIQDRKNLDATGQRLKGATPKGRAPLRRRAV